MRRVHWVAAAIVAMFLLQWVGPAIAAAVPFHAMAAQSHCTPATCTQTHKSAAECCVSTSCAQAVQQATAPEVAFASAPQGFGLVATRKIEGREAAPETGPPRLHA